MGSIPAANLLRGWSIRLFFFLWIHTICFCSRKIYLLYACAHTRQTDGKAWKRLDVYRFSITPLNFTGLQQIAKEYMVFSEWAHTYTVCHKNRNTRNQEYNHTHTHTQQQCHWRCDWHFHWKSSVELLKYQWLLTLVQGERDLAEWTKQFCFARALNVVLQYLGMPLVLWQRN